MASPSLKTKRFLICFLKIYGPKNDFKKLKKILVVEIFAITPPTSHNKGSIGEIIEIWQCQFIRKYFLASRVARFILISIPSPLGLTGIRPQFCGHHAYIVNSKGLAFNQHFPL